MNKGLTAVLAFSAGAVIGYFTANSILKEKYAQMAQEEIDSVKERFREQNKPEPEKKEPVKVTLQKEEFQKYMDYAKNLGYTQEANSSRQTQPRVIPPDEFGEIPEYDKVSLTYYADKVLVDENEKPMDETDIEMAIGSDSLHHFGEYEPDSVYVRNDAVKVDYEILMDERKYSEVLNRGR